MKKYLLAGMGILSFGALLTSCSKDPLEGLSQEDSRIYITNHDANASFTSYNTFTISDSVAVLNNNQVSREQTASDVAFINAVKAQMQARGYTLVGRNDSPDLAVNVNRVYNTSTGVITYDNYWGYYDDFYDPWYYGYGGYGYYSPYSYATYTIREGAMSIDILDLKNAPATNRIAGIWSGLIRGSGIFNANTAGSQIQALFDQSPYIRKNL
jgi:hypothetical protein